MRGSDRYNYLLVNLWVIPNLLSLFIVISFLLKNNCHAEDVPGKVGIGKANITVYVPSMLKLSGLKDSTLIIGNDIKSRIKEIPLCVYSNDSFGSIDVSMMNSGKSAPYVLSNGEKTANYKLMLKTNGKGERYFGPNAPRHSISGVSSKSDSCDGENNAALRIEIDQSVFENNSGKPFQGALTVLLEPS